MWRGPRSGPSRALGPSVAGSHARVGRGDQPRPGATGPHGADGGEPAGVRARRHEIGAVVAARALRVVGSAASRVVGNGGAMEQLPAVAEAHAAGALTADQMSVIGKVTAPRYLRLIAEQDGDLAGI